MIRITAHDYDIEEGSRQKTSLKSENTSFCKAFCDTVIVALEHLLPIFFNAILSLMKPKYCASFNSTSNRPPFLPKMTY